MQQEAPPLRQLLQSILRGQMTPGEPSTPGAQQQRWLRVGAAALGLAVGPAVVAGVTLLLLQNAGRPAVCLGLEQLQAAALLRPVPCLPRGWGPAVETGWPQGLGLAAVWWGRGRREALVGLGLELPLAAATPPVHVVGCWPGKLQLRACGVGLPYYVVAAPAVQEPYLLLQMGRWMVVLPQENVQW